MIESGQETALAFQTVIIRTYTGVTKMERERERERWGIGVKAGGRWQKREDRREGGDWGDVGVGGGGGSGPLN